MTLNPNYILRQIGEDTLLISIEDPSQPRRILFLNPMAKEIFLLLKEGLSQEQVEEKLLQEYDVSREQLREDMGLFLKTLTELNVITTDAV